MPDDPPPQNTSNISTGTGGGGATGAGASLGLDDVARQADIHVVMEDAAARKWIARDVVRTLIGTNSLILVGLTALAWLDQCNVVRKVIAPADRIVSSQVIMTLLGATTVQVGAVTVIIARYLFPGRSRDGV